MLSKKLDKNFQSLCLSIYPKKLTAQFIKNDKDFFRFLEKNRLNHYYAIRFKLENHAIKDYLEYRKKITASLKKLKEKLKGEQFIVIKTFSSYPHKTNDIDIIVKSKKNKEKFKRLRLPFPHDISDTISWTSSPEISKEFIWNNIQRYYYNGVQIYIPNQNLDVLIRMAHIPFEQAEIRLGELLHIFSKLKKVNWNLLESQARQNGWLKTYKKIKSLLNKLHRSLFFDKNPVEFPYRLSFLVLAQGVAEKKAWRKILGARFIIKDRLLSWLNTNY